MSSTQSADELTQDAARGTRPCLSVIWHDTMLHYSNYTSQHSILDVCSLGLIKS